MTKLRKNDLESFKSAILKDYGIELKGKELYQTAFNLLKFIDSLVKLKDKDLGNGFENHPGQPIEKTLKDKDNE